MKNLTSFIAGLLFAFGLGLSGMMNPEKVRGFLDLTRIWDPSLMFVMVGAIGVYAIAYRMVTKRAKPICEHEFSLPTKKNLETKLILGSAIFGIGWGIAGICPGPALSNLGTGIPVAFIFVAVMTISMAAVKMVEKKL